MKLYVGGYLDFYLPRNRQRNEIEILRPTRLSDLLTELGIPVSEVYLAIVNGQLVDPHESMVSDDDNVRIYSIVDGG